MSADVRLSLGAQAVLERRIRDIRLVQYALTDAAVAYNESGDTASAGLCLTESDVLRTSCNEIEAVLRVAEQDSLIRLISDYTKD